MIKEIKGKIVGYTYYKKQCEICNVEQSIKADKWGKIRKFFNNHFNKIIFIDYTNSFKEMEICGDCYLKINKYIRDLKLSKKEKPE